MRDMTLRPFRTSVHVVPSIACALWATWIGVGLTVSERHVDRTHVAHEDEGGAPPIGMLEQVSVLGRDDQVVVSLAADRPLDGRLRSLKAPRERVFIDLVGFVPGVDDVTDVDRSLVRRVRVGLNRTNPPVTRVVLDLKETAHYRLERTVLGGLRIIVEEISAGESVPTDGVSPYLGWLAETTATVGCLLDEPNNSGRVPWYTGTEREWRATADWTTAKHSVDRVTPPPRFRASHDALQTATQLGLKAASEGKIAGAESAMPSAARTGARLSWHISRVFAMSASPGPGVFDRDARR